jgi:hypothetical protein
MANTEGANVTTLTDALRELAQARASEEGTRRLVAALDAALASTPEGIALSMVREERSQKQAAIKAAESTVRELALAEHALSGDARPAEGVTVKLFSKVVYQQDEAEKWCFGHAARYLVLDSKAFEKAAPVLKDLGAPVEFAKEARAQIATDLGVWLVSDLRPYAQQKDPVMERLLASEENNLLREEQYLAEKNAR